MRTNIVFNIIFFLEAYEANLKVKKIYMNTHTHILKYDSPIFKPLDFKTRLIVGRRSKSN